MVQKLSPNRRFQNIIENKSFAQGMYLLSETVLAKSSEKNFNSFKTPSADNKIENIRVDPLAITGIRNDIRVIPELELVSTALEAYRNDEQKLEKESNSWGFGGKKLVLSTMGGMLGGLALSFFAVYLAAAKHLILSNILGWTACAVELASMASLIVLIPGEVGEQVRKLFKIQDPLKKKLTEIGGTVKSLRDAEQALLTEKNS